MPRETKLTEAVQARLCDALRAGNTRRAACAHAGISEDSLARYLRQSEDFAAAVTEAEAACERELVQVLRDAAAGVPTKRTHRGARDVVKQRKTRTPVIRMRRTTYEDGRVVEEPVRVGEEVVDEPVTVTLRSADTVEGFEYDWRAALEILKRRFRVDWGDRSQVDVRSLTDEQLLAMLGAEGPGDAPAAAGDAGEA